MLTDLAHGTWLPNVYAIHHDVHAVIRLSVQVQNAQHLTVPVIAHSDTCRCLRTYNGIMAKSSLKKATVHRHKSALSKKSKHHVHHSINPFESQIPHKSKHDI